MENKKTTANLLIGLSIVLLLAAIFIIVQGGTTGVPLLVVGLGCLVVGITSAKNNA